MNNQSEVIDDIEIESEFSDSEYQPTEEQDAFASDDGDTLASDEVSEDSLGDTELGQHLGELITEIRRDEDTFQQTAAPGEPTDGDREPDPFDPSDFSLDTSYEAPSSQPAATSSIADSGAAGVSETAPGAKSVGGSDAGDDVGQAIAQLVSEIESALQSFTQAERLRADQLIAEKEAQVAEQYRRVRNLANKVAKQKAQIQEARQELKAKLELADRLHIEFDSIRQVLSGKLGLLEQLEKEDEAAE